jgi:excisionase family DNA binding protein
VEPAVTITPAMVAMNPSRESDWARTVWSLVERAAVEGKSVQVSIVDRWCSATELARMCDVSRATVNRRILDGTIHAVRHGSRWRVPEVEVAKYRRFLMDQAAAAMADDF